VRLVDRPSSNGALAHVALLGFDLLVGFLWAFVVASYQDVHTTLDWMVVLWATFLAGLVTGRYRVVLAAAAMAVIAVVAVTTNPCTPTSGCEDDFPAVFQAIFLAALIGSLAFLMAFGVFLHKRWATLLRSGFSKSKTPGN
jgi:hypothetical protein